MSMLYANEIEHDSNRCFIIEFKFDENSEEHPIAPVGIVSMPKSVLESSVIDYRSYEYDPIITHKWVTCPTKAQKSSEIPMRGPCMLAIIHTPVKEVVTVATDCTHNVSINVFDSYGQANTFLKSIRQC